MLSTGDRSAKFEKISAARLRAVRSATLYVA
jgi:hypothetical protein